MKYLGEYYHTRLGATIALKLWQIKTYKEIEKKVIKYLVILLIYVNDLFGPNRKN
jgi:hypothetical protein